MSRFSLKKTFLLERNAERLRFQTESAPLLKGALLIGVVAFFLVTYSSGPSPQWVRLTISGYCLLGFLLMGNRSRVTIDRERDRITLERTFYFVRRAKVHPFSDCLDVTVETLRLGSRVRLAFKDGQRATLGASSSGDEAEIWRAAVASMLEK